MARQCLFVILAMAMIDLPGRAGAAVTVPAARAERAAGRTLSHAAQVRGLTPGEAARHQPVHLRGVVTYYDPAWGIFFVQDETGGIFVEPGRQKFEVQPGETVEVTGVSDKGDYRPVIGQPALHVLNAAPMPVPQAISLAEAFSGRADCQWVTVEGVIRTVSEQEGRVVLSVAGDGRRLKAFILNLPQGNRSDLIGAAVRLTGVCGTIADGKGNFLAAQLFVPSWLNLTVEKPAAGDAFAAPLLAISNLVSAATQPKPGEQAHVRGVVRAFKPGRSLTVDDGTGRLEIQTPQSSPVQSGVVVDVVGFMPATPAFTGLEDGAYRRLGYGPLPPADDATAMARRSLTNQTLVELTTAEQIRALKPAEAERGYPIQLRGVVTYHDAAWGVMFFQGATAGIYVDTGGQEVDVATGDLVRLYGYSGPGDFAPVVRRPLFLMEGKAPMPSARAVTLEQLLTGKEDSQWVEIDGMVRSINNDSDHARLKLATAGGTLNVIVPGFRGRPIPDQFLDAKVRVQGVCASLFDQKRRLTGVQLLVPDLGHVEIEQAGTADPWLGPQQSIGSLLHFSPQGFAHRVRVQGVVTCFLPRRGLFVRDPTGSIYVQTAQGPQVRVGDVVNLVGFPTMGHNTRILTDAAFRRVGSGPVPAAIPVNAEQVLRDNLDGELMQTEGYLIDEFTGGAEQVLVLQSGSGSFQAHLDRAQASGRLTWLRKGSRLRITGVGSVDVDASRQPQSFKILLRSPADVVVEAEPSWWTLRHVFTVVGILTAVVLLAVAWGLTLNHRVRRQTDQIRAQLRHEAALQERYRELFENANDVIYTHDLGGHFTSLNRAGERVLGYTRADVLGMSIQHLAAPSCREPFEQWLKAATEGAPPSPGEFELVAKDGRPVTLEMSAQRIWQGGQAVAVQVIARDTTGRKRNERYTSAFSGLSRQLSVARTPKEAAQVVSEIADELLGWDAFILDLWSPGQKHTRTVLAMDLIDGRRAEVPPGAPGVITPMMRRTVEEGPQLILREDPSKHPAGVIPFGDMSRPTAALMYVPVRQGAQPIGLLSIQSYQRNAYDPEKLRTLQALADHCAGALERIQAEERVRDIEAVYRRAIAAADAVPYYRDYRDEAFTYIGEGVKALTGFGGEELTPAIWESLIEEYRFRDDLRGLTFGEAVQKVRRGEVLQWQCDCRIRTRSGEPRWVADASVEITDAAGKPVASVGVLQDITERMRAQEALRQSEERFAKAFHASPLGISISRMSDGAFVDANDAFLQVFGYQREELIGRTSGELKMWPRLENREQLLQYLKLFGFARNLETQFRKQNGAIGITLSSFERVELNGEPHVLTLINDITDRKQAEEQIREQARLLELAQDAILVRDLEHRVTFWNQGAERLYGWTAAEACGRPVTELIFRETGAFETTRANFFERGEWSGELRQVTKAGQEVIVNSRWNLLRDEQGRPQSVLVIDTDITAQKQLETQFFRAQRLESVGTLASGIAHDLNNVLAPITMAAQMLQTKLLDEESRKMLETVAASAQRGADIVRQVLTFARGSEGERAWLQLRYLIKDAVKLMRQTFPKAITITARAPKDLWMVKGDTTQLHQVLLNLCLNARDAMPDGGVIDLRADNIELDDNFATMVTQAKAGAYVVLQVRDNGAGMDRTILDKIFDPFFTTKPAGQGTGLGLSTVLGIVKGHGGFVNVDSQAGKGSLFSVYLPATPGAKTPPAATGEDKLPRGRGELVLVVDDEAGIRGITERVLERYGYHTMTAADGAEALAVYSQQRDAVKLVLTDVMMPNMDGVALVRVLRKMNSQLKIVASSGAANGMDASPEGAELKALEVSAFLPKPYTADKLLGVLHELLAPTAPTAGDDGEFPARAGI